MAPLRAARAQLHIMLNRDSGCCRREIMARLMAEGVDLVLGLA